MADVAGRVLWAVVAALWPAVTALRAACGMHWWHPYLTWTLALAEAACAVILRARARERGRGQAREADAELRITALEAQVGAYGKALTAMAAYGRCESPVRAAGAGDCPEPGAARLRLVPPQGKRA